MAYSLFHLKRKESLVFLILMSFLYGLTIELGEDMDGVRHVERVAEHYSNLSLGQFIHETYSIGTLSGETGYVSDLYIHFISYIAAFFGGGKMVFFGLVGLIYGYFFFKSVHKIFERVNLIDNISYVLLALLFLWKGLEGMNTVRTWTALWVNFYFVFRYIETGKKHYMFLSFTSVLIHFSFLIFTIPLIVGKIFKFNLKVALLILIVSLGFRFISTSSNLLNLNIPAIGLLETKMKVYALEDEEDVMRYSSRVETGKEAANFYKGYYNDLTGAFTCVSLSLLLFFGLKEKHKIFLDNKNVEIYQLGVFIGVLLWSIGNFLDFVPAVFNRGITVAGIFNITVLLINWPTIKKWTILHFVKLKSTYSLLLLPTTVIVFVYKGSSLLGFMSMSLLAPLCLLPITYDVGSIRELIKFFL